MPSAEYFSEYKLERFGEGDEGSEEARAISRLLRRIAEGIEERDEDE